MLVPLDYSQFYLPISTVYSFFFFSMILRPPRSTLFPTRRSSDLEALDLEFPGPPSPPATLPTVTTFFDRAANASLVDLIGIGRSLLARLEREGCRVNVAIEREVTATRVANSAGAAGEYRGTGFGVSADVWRI